MRNLGIVQALPPASAVGPQQVAGGTQRQVVSVLAAGASLAIPGNGVEFYFDLLSAPINARPYVGGTPGIFNSYVEGTGQNVDLLQQGNTYSAVEIQNPNAFAVTYSIRLGFQGFLDRRLVLPSTTTVPVTLATYGAPNTLASVAINDISNQQFTDLNGNPWIAISRVAVRISNLSLQALPIYNAAGTVVTDEVMPNSAYYLNSSGNFLAKVGSGNINGTIAEIYNAIRPTS